MTENWIYNEQHDRLTLGDNDISMAVPQCQLRDYARMATENRPVSLPTGFYIPTGWTATDCPNRVTVRLSRYSAKVRSIENAAENIEWRAV